MHIEFESPGRPSVYASRFAIGLQTTHESKELSEYGDSQRNYFDTSADGWGSRSTMGRPITYEGKGAVLTKV